MGPKAIKNTQWAGKGLRVQTLIPRRHWPAWQWPSGRRASSRLHASTVWAALTQLPSLRLRFVCLGTEEPEEPLSTVSQYYRRQMSPAGKVNTWSLLSGMDWLPLRGHLLTLSHLHTFFPSGSHLNIPHGGNIQLKTNTDTPECFLSPNDGCRFISGAKWLELSVKYHGKSSPFCGSILGYLQGSKKVFKMTRRLS